MSWSDQHSNGFQEQSDINVLKQNYANAELAYQALHRDYEKTLAELKKTQRIVKQLHQQSTETDQAFNQLKREMTEKVNQIDQLTSSNQNQFEQLNQHKQGLDREVSAIVHEEIEQQKADIIRMDRFTEYFPTVLSLIALTGVLYFIFGT